MKKYDLFRQSMISYMVERLEDIFSLDMFNVLKSFSSLKKLPWMIFDAQPTAQKSLRVSSIIQRIYFCYARLKLYSLSTVLLPKENQPNSSYGTIKRIDGIELF